MKALLAILMTVLGVIYAAGAVAHHSFASEYTDDKPLAMKGVVTLVEWTNPHARIYIDVVNEDNTVTTWNLELASPSALSRNGWTSRSLQAGDAVSITGFGARADDTYRVNVKSVTLADGRNLFNGRAPDSPE